MKCIRVWGGPVWGRKKGARGEKASQRIPEEFPRTLEGNCMPSNPGDNNIYTARGDTFSLSYGRNIHMCVTHDHVIYITHDALGGVDWWFLAQIERKN